MKEKTGIANRQYRFFKDTWARFHLPLYGEDIWDGSLISWYEGDKQMTSSKYKTFNLEQGMPAWEPIHLLSNSSPMLSRSVSVSIRFKP
jgi:hypothetical protein